MAGGSNFGRLNAESPNTWSKERIDRARYLWVERGWSAAQVAKDLKGVTRSAVIGKAYRMGWKREAAAIPSAGFTWTPELDERLRRAVDAGETDFAIAADLGAPIRAVSHRRDRLGLRKRGVYRKPAAVFASRPDADVSPGVTREPTPVVPDGAIGPRTILTLEPGECRWPLAMDGEERTFCGCERAEGRPYCSAHFTMSIAAVQPAKPTAKSLRRFI